MSQSQWTPSTCVDAGQKVVVGGSCLHSYANATKESTLYVAEHQTTLKFPSFGERLLCGRRCVGRRDRS